ncbi:MAG: hypothetical protein KJ040_09135 [Gammaproteobacteria bacterium]|nr:hypothetical protein [Gammaproteobacteria bacterium]
MRRTASHAAKLRLILVLFATSALGTGLTACMHLPPAVAAEMQPAAPPASNHYRKPPATGEASQDATATH